MKENSFVMDQWMEKNLVCPRDHQRLRREGNTLVCSEGHSYPIVDGIPVMLLNDVVPTQEYTTISLEQASSSSQETETEDAQEKSTSDESDGIDPHVQEVIGATGGILYTSLVGNLTRYPIPELRLPPGNNKVFLDIGCNWGRWCVAAARRGYQPIGIDPNLDAIKAARKVSRQLGVSPRFVVADGRYLPFASGSFDVVFSYSVLQHFSKDDAKLSVAEAGRVLEKGGFCFIQMPNILGIRCLFHQAKRGFREPRDFEVRYWSLRELKHSFSERIGPTSLSIDGFFGLGIQKSDLDILPPKYKLIVAASELLRKMSRRARGMISFADSVYVKSTRS